MASQEAVATQLSVLLPTVSSMKMPNEWLGEATQMLMTDRYAQATAPVVLWGAVLSLTGGVTPTSLMVQMETAAEHTEWRAVWSTDSLVGFASVAKDEERWTAYSDDYHADTVTAWARDIRDVQAVQLRDVDCKQVGGYGERETDWRWSVGARVLFGDGSHVDLPPSGTSRSDEHDVQIREFLNAITKR